MLDTLRPVSRVEPRSPDSSPLQPTSRGVSATHRGGTPPDRSNEPAGRPHPTAHPDRTVAPSSRDKSSRASVLSRLKVTTAATCRAYYPRQVERTRRPVVSSSRDRCLQARRARPGGADPARGDDSGVRGRPRSTGPAGDWTCTPPRDPVNRAAPVSRGLPAVAHQQSAGRPHQPPAVGAPRQSPASATHSRPPRVSSRVSHPHQPPASATHSRSPTVGHPQSIPSSQTPAVSHPQSIARARPRTASHPQPATRSQPLAASHPQPVTRGRSPAASHPHPAIDCP